MPHVRHIIGLCALLLLVGYFGVWRGYEMARLLYGPAWGMIAALAMLAGLIVIAIVGCIVIRTMRTTGRVGTEAKKAKNQAR